MYKIMIAEDEPLINDGIRKMIETFAPEYEVRACACDGEEALEWLKKEKFDIVFTDIRMPVIDGLELLRYIDTNHPQIITVVISGYEVFDYAQKALKYHVFEYLLKPVSADGMKELLKRIDRRLHEREERQREKFYHKTFGGKDIGEEAHTNSPYCYRMYLLNAGSLRYEEEEDKEDKQDTEIIDRVEEILSESLINTPRESWFWFQGRLAAEYVMIKETDKRNKEEERDIINDLYKALLIENFPVTVIKSGEICGMDGFYREYRILRRKISERLIYGYSMYFSEDCEVENLVNKLLKEEREDIFLWAKAEHIKQLEKKLSVLLEKFEEKRVTQAVLEELLQQIFQIIANGVRNGKHFSKPVLEKEIRLALSRTCTYEALMRMLREILSVLMGKEEAEEERLVDTIKQYLDDNFSEKVTTKELSKRFGLVPSYLSMLFRQAKGMSPSEYVNHLRIRKAKELLREDMTLTVKEIAEIIGYADQLYFSKVFKKETGKTPSQFRNESKAELLQRDR